MRTAVMKFLLTAQTMLNRAPELLAGRRIRARGLCAMTLSILFSAASHAQISLNRSVIDLWQALEKEPLTIRNSSSDTVNLVLRAYEIQQPHLLSAKRVPLSVAENALLDINLEADQIVPGGQTELTLFSKISPGISDRVIRIHISQQAGSIDTGIDDGKTVIPAVKLLIAYELLVIIRAENPKISLSATRESNTLILTNNGNTAALVSPVNACEFATESCYQFEANRLYAGEQFRIESNLSQPLSVRGNVSDGKSTSMASWD